MSWLNDQWTDGKGLLPFRICVCLCVCCVLCTWGQRCDSIVGTYQYDVTCSFSLCHTWGKKKQPSSWKSKIIFFMRQKSQEWTQPETQPDFISLTDLTDLRGLEMPTWKVLIHHDLELPSWDDLAEMPRSFLPSLWTKASLWPGGCEVLAASSWYSRDSKKSCRDSGKINISKLIMNPWFIYLYSWIICPYLPPIKSWFSIAILN